MAIVPTTSIPLVVLDVLDIEQCHNHQPDQGAFFHAVQAGAGVKIPRRFPIWMAKGREDLLAFYDFPAEHWQHVRTTNPIESVFATVRHRTVRTKGCLSHKTAMTMVFRLITVASKTGRRLSGNNRLPQVIEGVRFRDGIQVKDADQSAAV